MTVEFPTGTDRAPSTPQAPLAVRLIQGAFLMFIVVFGWHCIQLVDLSSRVANQSDAAMEVAVRVNWFTNHVDVSFHLPDEADGFAMLGAALGASLAEPLVEEALAEFARERFDVYAMLVPYRVSARFAAVRR